MTLFRLVTRHLWHARASHLMTAAAVAVATAVIAGSLLIGDSTRATLRDLALQRLGPVEHVVQSAAPFRAQLADELADASGLACEAALLLPCEVVDPTQPALNRPAQLVGVRPPFLGALGSRAGALPARGAFLAGRGVTEAGFATDDLVLVRVPSLDAGPRQGVFGRTRAQDTVRTIRLRVTGVSADDPAGTFDLEATRTSPINVIVDLDWLATELGLEGQANTLLIHGDDVPAKEAVAETLARSVRLADYGMHLQPSRSFADEQVLLSDSFLLDERVVKSLRQRIPAARRLSVHLANRLLAGGAEEAAPTVPYSTVLGLEGHADLPPPPPSGYEGRPPPVPVLLNRWTAEQLRLQKGGELVLSYYSSGEDGGLGESSFSCRVAGVLPMEGLGIAADLVPAYPGLTDSDTMDNWDPPFPVDLKKIRDIDEVYWETWRAAPKVILPYAVVAQLWRGADADARAPATTGMLLPLSASAETIVAAVHASSAGLRLQDARAQALAAAQGTTDLGGLFLALGFFIVAAGVLLEVLLVQLLLMDRQREIGTLKAVGWTEARVRRWLLIEAGVVLFVGAILGGAAGVAYATGVTGFLHGAWSAAVAGMPVRLVVSPVPLAIGMGAGLVIGGGGLVLSLRRMLRRSAHDLLGGSSMADEETVSARRPRHGLLAAVLLGAGGLLAIVSLAMPGMLPVAVAFGCTGALALAGSLFAASWWLARPLPPVEGISTWLLVLRNLRRHRGRSLAVTSLIACAGFLVVTVAANHKPVSAFDVEKKTSGSGGFRWQGELTVPLFADPGTEAGREQLAFSDGAKDLLATSTVVPLRVREGDDTSCLNLNQPRDPRVLGVSPQAMRGRFTFTRNENHADGSAPDSPWDLLDDDLPEGVIPAVADAASAQWILKVGLGDEITVRGSSGETVRLRLVGLLRGSLFQDGVVISNRHFASVFGDRHGVGRLLVACPAEQAEAVEETLAGELADFGVRFESTREILHRFIELQNTYLVAFASLGGLGLALGALGVAAVLARAVLERRNELALLVAIGFRPPAVWRLITFEHALMILVGGVLGGMCALLATAPRLLSGDATADWLLLGGVAAGSAALALGGCALAASHALRGSLLEGLRGE